MQHPFINDLMRFFGVTVPVIVAWVVLGAIALDWVLHWLMHLLFSCEIPTKEHEISAYALGFLHSFFILSWIYTEREKARRAEEQAGLLSADAHSSEVPAESAAFRAAGFGSAALRVVFLFFPLFFLWGVASMAVIEYGSAVITGEPAWSDDGWGGGYEHICDYIGGVVMAVFCFWWGVWENRIAKRRKAEWAARQSEWQGAQLQAG